VSRISTKTFYILSIVTVCMFSFYPLQMGARVLLALWQDGYVRAEAYPKYLIPYTPIVLAILASVVLLPLFVRLCKKWALLSVSVFGAGMFLLTETLFEQITVFSLQEGTADIGSWQTYLCIATPQVMETVEYRETIGAALAERYNPVFKLHFYLIALLIVFAVIGLVHGIGKTLRTQDHRRWKPLILQAASVAVFIGLCILACFTAFYRTGDINISALSAGLMSVFFIVFGLTAGAYAGSLLYGASPVFARLIPAAIAVLTAILMYVGELVMMGGTLFRFGTGILFEPLGAFVLAPVDLLVIAVSGLLTHLLLYLMRDRRTN